MGNSKYADEIKNIGRKGIGRSSLLKHLWGEELTKQEAIEGHCYDCMNFYIEGVRDCKEYVCPLYPFFPYKDVEVE